MLGNPGSDAVYFDDCRCEGETERAIRVSGSDFDEGVWIPKSALHDDSDVYSEGDEGRLAVKLRFARRKGWS